MALARTFTREQFYELVWSKPMTHLAKEFALSDVALHKICRKHGIPNPPLGWWAKKAAGKRVKQIPLPPAENGVLNQIIIASADLSREALILAEAREKARILASKHLDNKGAEAHPIIEGTLTRLRKAKPSDIGIVSTDGSALIRCEVAMPSVDRLEAILPPIVEAASLQGFELTSGDRCARFKSDTETVSFSISEAIRRESHILTDTERAKQDAWQRKRDRAALRNSWDELFFDRPRFPEWDYHPTGKLSFEFEHVYVFEGSAPRRSFRDAKIQRLENMASDVAVGLAVLAVAKTEERLRREAHQRRIDEERRRREAAARIKHVEDRRTAGLQAVLTELDELDRLRRLIAMLTAETAAEPTARVSAFLAWSKAYLTSREARLSAKQIEDRFAAEHLFGDDDDYAFIPSRW